MCIVPSVIPSAILLLFLQHNMYVNLLITYFITMTQEQLSELPCIYILNKNTLGVKKVRGQSEAALQTGATKNFDIS